MTTPMMYSPDCIEQAWTDEVQKIVCEFVQNDVDLGMRMLDHSEPFWEECREAGLTPQQALDKAIKLLGGGTPWS